MTIPHLAAVELPLLEVAAQKHYFADGFQLPDKPCSRLYKARKTNGSTEVKGFDVAFRGITEQSHRVIVQLPEHLARCRTHLALRHQYSAAALNSTQANTAPLPTRLEHALGIDAMGANQ